MKKRRLPVRYTGQHFTVDTNLIKDAIKLADIHKEDIVLDIGAGSGFLTVHLIKHSKKVIAIENDLRLVSELQSKFSKTENVSIFKGDYRAYRVPQEDFKVVSNIPFAISSEILQSLMFENLEFFNQGCLIMQLQRAEKLLRQRFFNPYMAFYHTFYKLDIIYQIQPESFMPPPTVTSALVRIRKKENVVPLNNKMKEDYHCFLRFLLKHPEVPARTALKKLFRKKQVRELARCHDISLEKPVSTMSAEQFYRCFETMVEIIPKKLHPSSG